MYVCACVSFSLCVRACVRACARVCVCVSKTLSLSLCFVFLMLLQTGLWSVIVTILGDIYLFLSNIVVYLSSILTRLANLLPYHNVAHSELL